QELVCECASDSVLDQACHRTRTHQRIEALLAEISLQSIAEGRFDPLLMQLILKLHQELVDDTDDDLFGQRRERDDGIESVPELRAEQSLDIAHLITGAAWLCEADAG